MSLSTDYALFLTLFKTPLTNVKKLHNLIICTAQITKIGHQKLSPSCDQYSFNMSLNCENAVFTLLPINSLQRSPTLSKKCNLRNSIINSWRGVSLSVTPVKPPSNLCVDKARPWSTRMRYKKRNKSSRVDFLDFNCPSNCRYQGLRCWCNLEIYWIYAEFAHRAFHSFKLFSSLRLVQNFTFHFNFAVIDISLKHIKISIVHIW